VENKCIRPNQQLNPEAQMQRKIEVSFFLIVYKKGLGNAHLAFHAVFFLL
jgi:hypothetical protein